MPLIDSYLYDYCKEASPNKTREYITSQLKVYDMSEYRSEVFYEEKYVISVDWRLII